jgi:hypothetical protein
MIELDMQRTKTKLVSADRPIDAKLTIFANRPLKVGAFRTAPAYTADPLQHDFRIGVSPHWH